ncbi:MAG: hypothetical protein K2I78_04965, partial [Clostridia bacterium]|nr:hypothetical protein [Clostridia bacterium]
MDIRKRKIKGIFVLSVLIILCLCVASVLSFFMSQQPAEALKDTSAAIKVGDGVDIWNSANDMLNINVFNDLTTKLFGESDWLTYVKSMKDTDTDSYVIPASVINEKAGNANGLIVKLGGLEWMVSSLTLTNDGNEDIVVTLYLADVLINTSRFFRDTTSVKGHSMYSSSELRNTLLTSGDFQLFSSGEFAERYLVQPKNIKYQLNQSIVGRGAAVNYNYPNDALGAIASGWSDSINYQPSDIFEGKRYDDWGNDYIWIPSATEIGWNDLVAENSIWKLSSSQRSHNTNYVWLRSGAPRTYGAAYVLQSSGDFSGDSNYLTDILGIRPAIHLNLDAIKVSEPTDVSTEYTGENQTIANAPTEQKAWYSADVVDLEYPASGMKDAATYKVKATIKPELQAEEIKFNGTPNTAAGEDDYTRYFTFTITKKKIGIEE